MDGATICQVIRDQERRAHHRHTLPFLTSASEMDRRFRPAFSTHYHNKDHPAWEHSVGTNHSRAA
jgi:hypothetical protein